MKLLNQTHESLADYTCRQIAAFFPDGGDIEVRNLIRQYLPESLDRLAFCINSVRMWPQGQFNYLNSSQYCQYLYYLGNTIWQESHNTDVPTRLFLLNKALNGIDLFYEIKLPEVFFIGHSVGIVLAKATYGNYLVLYQNSTVGKNHGVAPVIGDGVVMYPSTSIIGRCNVANGTILSPGTCLVNQDTPGNCYAFQGVNGAPVFKPATYPVLADIFRL